MSYYNKRGKELTSKCIPCMGIGNKLVMSMPFPFYLLSYPLRFVTNCVGIIRLKLVSIEVYIREKHTCVRIRGGFEVSTHEIENLL